MSVELPPAELWEPEQVTQTLDQHQKIGHLAPTNLHATLPRGKKKVLTSKNVPRNGDESLAGIENEQRSPKRLLALRSGGGPGSRRAEGTWFR